MTRRTLIFLPLVLLCILVVGIGGNLGRPRSGTVIGTVTLDGRPLSDGSVLMASEVRSWATIGIVHEGAFRIDDIPPGPVRVGIRGADVPARYEDPGRSGEQFDITPGQQSLLIRLTER